MLFFNKIIFTLIPYYYNPSIHNFGNIGIGGKIHAEIALFASHIIDIKAYNGKNIRKEILEPYEKMSQLDLCCGIGYSTMNNDKSVGLDTSPEMIKVAKRYYPDKKFLFGNSENYCNNKKYDIVTCMFALHEVPLQAQLRIIKNGIKNAKYKFIIVDISTNYKPSRMMLTGEPYLLEYLANIDKILTSFNKTVFIENHIDIWEYNI
jgi:ubiquinone/menaquinone biosynthesis C-methylase UbiE